MASRILQLLHARSRSISRLLFYTPPTRHGGNLSIHGCDGFSNSLPRNAFPVLQRQGFSKFDASLTRSNYRNLATQSDNDQYNLEDDSDEGFGLENDQELSFMVESKSETDGLSVEHRTLSKENGSYDIAESDTSDDDIGNAGCDDLKATSLLDMACKKDAAEEMGDKKRPLWMRIEEATGAKSLPVRKIIDDWIDEENPFSRAVIIFTITVLRRRKKYWKALEVSDWLMTEKPFDLTEMDYGIRVELISKVQGAQKAADYFGTIPKQFQTAMTYTILLTNFVEHNKEKEAIKLVQQAENLALGHRTYMYNQLLHMYKKNGLMAGVAEVLKTMDEKNVDPDIYTYNIILDVRARKGDVSGMEKVWYRLKDEHRVTADAATYAILARGYLVAGMPEKAEKMVRKIETSSFRRKRLLNLMLLKLYGQLGKKEDLERIWALVEQGQKVSIAAYEAMIRSLGMIGEIDQAEDLFEEMIEKAGSKNVDQYNALLSVYANLGKTKKGESLVKKIVKASFNPNPSTYHELVLMYLKSAQEQKAMEILLKAQKASRTSTRLRPLYTTFQTTLEWFAEKGDVKNAEKIIRDLKDCGYSCSYRSYIVLLKTYENAHITPYGFLDRIRADNVIPNQYIRKELKRLEGT